MLGKIRWQQIDSMTCSIARTLSVVGDRWTLLIVRDVFLGISRFNAIQQDLQLTPVCTKNFKSAEKASVLRWAAVVSPACLSSRVRSSQFLPADSEVERF